MFRINSRIIFFFQGKVRDKNAEKSPTPTQKADKQTEKKAKETKTKIQAAPKLEEKTPTKPATQAVKQLKNTNKPKIAATKEKVKPVAVKPTKVEKEKPKSTKSKGKKDEPDEEELKKGLEEILKKNKANLNTDTDGNKKRKIVQNEKQSNKKKAKA